MMHCNERPLLRVCGWAGDSSHTYRPIGGSYTTRGRQPKRYGRGGAQMKRGHKLIAALVAVAVVASACGATGSGGSTAGTATATGTATPTAVTRPRIHLRPPELYDATNPPAPSTQFSYTNAVKGTPNCNTANPRHRAPA